MFFLIFPHFFFFFFLFYKKPNFMICYSNKKKNYKILYKIFFLGYSFFKDLFESILIAKKSIFVQFYIFRNDYLGKIFLYCLKNRSNECTILLIVDNIGSSNFTFSHNKILFFKYNKETILINLRNHKKIVFIDSKILFIGGNNVGLEYLGINTSVKKWNDFHCKIINFYPNFLINDYIIPTNNNYLIKKIEICKKIFYLDNFMKDFINFLIFFVKKKLVIMSPYIILDKNLINLVKNLLNKRVDITIYVSCETDNLYIQISSLIFLKFLMNYKVKIFFLSDGFFHRKIYIIDSDYIIFGSMNFDIRSIFINKECLILIKDACFKKIFYEELNKQIISISMKTHKKKPILLKFIYIFSFLNYFIQ